MQPTRRRLLTTSTLAATGIASAWIAQAFGASRQRQPVESLLNAWKEARTAGRPLLLLVIPEDLRDRWSYGRDWGAVLNHGSAQVRSALSLCDLRCVTYPEIRAAFGEELALRKAPLPTAVPMAVLLETRELSARTLAVPTEMAQDPHAKYGDDTVVKARMAALGASLHAAILPSPERMSARRGQEQAALQIDTSRMGDEQLAQHAPATLLARCAKDQSRMERAHALLAERFEKRMEEHLPGALWAHSSGCGVRIEGDESPMMIACGMGHVPAVSRRFLKFFAG